MRPFQRYRSLCCTVLALLATVSTTLALVSEQCENESDKFSDSTELREAFGKVEPVNTCTVDPVTGIESCTHDYTKVSVSDYVSVCHDLSGSFFRVTIDTNCTAFDGTVSQQQYQNDPYCFGSCTESELKELFTDAFEDDNCIVSHMEIASVSGATPTRTMGVKMALGALIPMALLFLPPWL